MIKRILFFLALIFIAFIIYRLVNEEAADSLVDKVKNEYFANLTNKFSSDDSGEDTTIMISDEGEVVVINDTKEETTEEKEENVTTGKDLQETEKVVKDPEETNTQEGDVEEEVPEVEEKMYTKEEVEKLVKKLIEDGVVYVKKTEEDEVPEKDTEHVSTVVGVDKGTGETTTVDDEEEDDDESVVATTSTTDTPAKTLSEEDLRQVHWLSYNLREE